jgi:hypothetical protein
MDDSAAATVKIKSEKTCPRTSSMYIEKTKKLQLTASNISSIDISITMIFLRFKKIPQMPNRNKLLEKPR